MIVPPVRHTKTPRPGGGVVYSYKDLSNIYVNEVSKHRFNQSYHDTSFWYHGLVASIKFLTGSLASLELTGSMLNLLAC